MPHQMSVGECDASSLKRTGGAMTGAACTMLASLDAPMYGASDAAGCLRKSLHHRAGLSGTPDRSWAPSERQRQSRGWQHAYCVLSVEPKPIWLSIRRVFDSSQFFLGEIVYHEGIIKRERSLP
jgi:hypothetical protein